MVDSFNVIDAPDPGVTAEPNWGNANLHTLPRAERKKRAARMRARQERWQRAQSVRANWTPEQFAEEEARLQAEIAAWAEEQRDAA